MKKLALMCVVCALFVAGCGKKKEKQADKKSTVSKSFIIKDTPVKSKKKHVAINDFALKETEDFFDNEAISDFSFIDAESEKVASLDQNVVSDEASEQFMLPEPPQELALVQNDDILEEDEEPVVFEQIEDDSFTKDGEAPAQAYAFKTIHFDLNGNKVQEEEKELLAYDCKVAQDAVKEGKTIVIQGHCCQLGSHSYNMALSHQRAQSVKKTLVKNGIEEHAIKTVGYGNEMPIVEAQTQDRAALIQELAPNRRAEIIIN